MERAARLLEDAVVDVIYASPEWATKHIGGVWVAATGDATVGGTYVDGKFIPPRPHQSWSWDGEEWQPPVPKPGTPLDEGFIWAWSNDAAGWVEFEVPPVEDE